MQHLFISDIHYGAFADAVDQEIEKDLISLISYCKSNKIQIHLLGDLFDYWMEYPNFVPELGKKILDEFESYNEMVNPVTYITGNHDNWTLGHFRDRGFEVEEDFKILDLDNYHCLLHHGDGIGDPEFKLSRPIFHRLLRNKTFIKIYQKIFPPEAGLHLMKSFSQISKRNPVTDIDRLNKWAENLLQTSKFDVIISGHDHQPRVETFSYGTYINLGTFFQHRLAVMYTNYKFLPVKWNSEKCTFTLYTNSN